MDDPAALGRWTRTFDAVAFHLDQAGISPEEVAFFVPLHVWDAILRDLPEDLRRQRPVRLGGIRVLPHGG